MMTELEFRAKVTEITDDLPVRITLLVLVTWMWRVLRVGGENSEKAFNLFYEDTRRGGTGGEV